ncbi:MAG: hypothetical protein RR272_05170 [Synergistaceae bacterium]
MTDKELKITESLNNISREKLEKHKYFLSNKSNENLVIIYYAVQSATSLIYSTLNVLEICLRNKIYNLLSDFYIQKSKSLLQDNNPCQWYLWMPKNQETMNKISEAVKDANRKILTRPIIPGDIVSRLSFGVWYSILGERSNNNDPLFFWTPIKNKLFPNTKKTKGEILNEINWAKKLRNRIFHHEGIGFDNTQSLNTLHTLFLEKHNRLLKLISWVSPSSHETYSNNHFFNYQELYNQRIDSIFNDLKKHGIY